MAFKDFRYLAAYVIPLLAFLGIAYGGIWSISIFLFVFLIIPLLELVISPNPVNLSNEEIAAKKVNVYFEILLYLNIPILFFILYYFLENIANQGYSTIEMMGITLGVGIVLATNGINVAHEIGHRESIIQKFLAKLLLMPSQYMHFIIEHNVGHHKNVGTPEDAATARYNENLYAFWIRSISQGYVNAWKIEYNKLRKHGRIAIHYRNEMLWFTIIQVGFIGSILWFYGGLEVALYLAAAIMGFTLLETINYIEHYGLLRLTTERKRYERVDHIHSWNSDHELGRIFLYELTRHSDHHYKANKKYQILKSHKNSPQLPFGYPGSMLLAIFPPLWFSIMNKRIPNNMKSQLIKEHV